MLITGNVKRLIRLSKLTYTRRCRGN